MPVYFEITLPKLDIPRVLLRRTIYRVLRGEGRDHAAVTIVFVDDAYIRTLNKEYRHLDRATDVLSFSLDDGTAPDEAIGDVYVSIDRARDQAVRYHVSLNDELQRLVVHGCLHHDRKPTREYRGLSRSRFHPAVGSAPARKAT